MNEFYELSRDILILMAHKLQPKFQELGIYPGQEVFLNIIANNDGITAIELASLTNRKRSTITKALQSLEKNGYIEKKTSSDKRKLPIYITPKGKELNEEVLKNIKSIWSDLEKKITEEEKNTVINLLKKIKEDLKEEKC